MNDSEQKPIVSTITACYNMGRYLETFLNELPKQTIFDQLQVVLDHNEPSSEEVELVKNFQEKYPGRIKHIVTSPVIKQSESWNKCIKHADADLVAIWNVDDLRTPDSLEKQATFLKNNSDYGAVYGNFIIVPKFGSFHGKSIDHTFTLLSPKELTRSFVLGPFFMFRKNLCQKIGYFDEQLYSGADFDLAVRLRTAAKIGMVHGFLGYFLDEGQGASTRINNKQALERTLIEQRYGIIDKVDQRWAYEVSQSDYDMNNLLFEGKKIPVESYFEDFEGFKQYNSVP